MDDPESDMTIALEIGRVSDRVRRADVSDNSKKVYYLNASDVQQREVHSMSLPLVGVAFECLYGWLH